MLALLPASIGNTPRDATEDLTGGNASDLTGADVRMAAAATIANLSQSLPNRCIHHQSSELPLHHLSWFILGGD